jgi:hypothetical protein
VTVVRAGEHEVIMSQLETTGADERTVVRWDPADPQSVERARAEFERLRVAGYLLFALVERPGASVETKAPAFQASLGAFTGRSPVPRQTRTFEPEATRIVAVRPMRGG